MAVLSYWSGPAALLLYVCLSYISRELQQLPHSPHYINLPFILKCVPACLAQNSVQGKGICFVPCPLPHRLSLFHSRPMGEMERAREEGGGGGGHDKRAVSSESRRTQMSKPWIWGRPCNPHPFFLFVFLPLHPHHSTPSFAHSSLCLHFFFSVALRQACPDSAQSAALPPLLSPGPHNYSLGSVIRVKWSDKSAVCVCMCA